MQLNRIILGPGRLALRIRREWTLRRAARIIIGAGGTVYPGWVSTDQHILDVTNHDDFRRYWRPATREAFLAEHVWEHLAPTEAALANRNCFEFLRPGGRLRLAIPDGLHPDPDYIEWVRPGGVGPGAVDHKVLHTYHSLREALLQVGFEVRLLEYWNDAGEFHATDWNPADGMITRSARFDSRNAEGRLMYTSLIVDAVRPR